MAPKRKTPKESPLPAKRTRKEAVFEDYVVETTRPSVASVKSPARGKKPSGSKAESQSPPAPAPKATTKPSKKRADSPLPAAPASRASRAAPAAPAPEAATTAAPSRRSARSGPTAVSAPEPSSTIERDLSASSSTSGQILFGDIPRQVAGTLLVAVMVAITVFTVHFSHDVYQGTKTLADAPNVVKSMGVVLMWVVFAILLPFVATTIVVLVTNTVTHGSPAVQGLLAAAFVAIIGVIAVHREKFF